MRYRSIQPSNHLEHLGNHYRHYSTQKIAITVESLDTFLESPHYVTINGFPSQPLKNLECSAGTKSPTICV